VAIFQPVADSPRGMFTTLVDTSVPGRIYDAIIDPFAPVVVASTAKIISATPASFSGLTPDEARWTPIAMLLQIRSGDSVYVHVYRDNDLVPQIAYDPVNGFWPLWSKSSLVQQADPTQYLLTIIPNGGWNSPNVNVVPVSGVNLADPT